MAACHYLKDRMAEVSSPNKEMVRKGLVIQLILNTNVIMLGKADYN